MTHQVQAVQDDPYAELGKPTRDGQSKVVPVQGVQAPLANGGAVHVVIDSTRPAGFHPWLWLAEGQNGIVLAAGLSLIVSAFTVLVLCWTLRAVRQQTRAAEDQAKAARSQARLAELQIREATRGRRLAKRRRQVDESVWAALVDARQWIPAGGRPMTGAGAVAVKPREIAEHVKASQKAVEASLWRLEARGRATDQGGSFDDIHSHWWTVAVR